MIKTLSFSSRSSWGSDSTSCWRSEKKTWDHAPVQDIIIASLKAKACLPVFFFNVSGTVFCQIQYSVDYKFKLALDVQNNELNGLLFLTFSS